MKNILVAKVILRDPSGRMLLLRRSASDTRRPHDWDLPGGGVEPDENFILAAIRETKEEAGIEVAVGQLELLYTGTEFYAPKGENVHRSLFIARASDEQARNVTLSHEHDSYKWATLDEVLEDFNHPFYSVGVRYAVDHGFLG